MHNKGLKFRFKLNQSELVGDVAVSVSVRQAVLFCAFRNPDARPRLNWRRSSSTVLSQVCLGRPGRRFQFFGVAICRLGEQGNDPGTWVDLRQLPSRATINCMDNVLPFVGRKILHTYSLTFARHSIAKFLKVYEPSYYWSFFSSFIHDTLDLNVKWCIRFLSLRL